ncbi:MAG: hypothetical protein JOZ72_07900 [Alphaproteobacteria bacterium]|nr:hypothetical protein [Alphaproteobacteria bacterium]
MDDERDLEVRLQNLLAKRGQELVKGLVEEVSSLHREIAGLKRELGALADYQATRARWLEIDGATTRTLRLPTTVTIEADHLLRPRDGFYAMEYTDVGRPFRWTGPLPQFSFDVFIDRRPGVDLKLEALSCIDFEQQKDVMLVVDGAPVSVELEPNGSGFDWMAFLPPRDDARSSNIVFVLPAVLTPSDGNDPRPMGIAFARLTLVARESAPG